MPYKDKQQYLLIGGLCKDKDKQDSLLPSSTGILNVIQRQTAVTAYLKSKQLPQFVFELQDFLLPSSTGILTVMQKPLAVTADL